MKKFFKIYDFPLNWIRKVTIPPCNEKEYDNYYVMGWPFFSIPIYNYLFFNNLPGIKLVLFILVFGGGWAYIWWRV